MSVQEALNESYRPLVDPKMVLERLQPGADGPAILRELNGPFLIATNDQYEAIRPRVVVVGQENNGWLPGSYGEFLANRSIEFALEVYDDFLCKWPYNSTFFQYFAEIRFAIRGSKSDDVKRSILWSNLFKLNHNGKHTLSSPHLRTILTLQDGVFRKEIVALQPDAVIFLTGPRYDWVIARFFGEATQFIPIDGHAKRQVAQVVADGLPKLSFRSYHPGFINRNRASRMPWYEAIVQRITSEFA